MKGTGRKGAAPGFRVGAKTGTAEMADVGGYSRHRNVSTFAAAFPMANPRYVVVATLVAPHGLPDTYGRSTAAWNAAPAVADRQRVVWGKSVSVRVDFGVRRDIKKNKKIQ